MNMMISPLESLMCVAVTLLRWRLLCGEAVRGLHTGGSGSLAVWESTSLSLCGLEIRVGDIGAGPARP